LVDIRFLQLSGSAPRLATYLLKPNINSLLREHPSRLGDVPRVPETNQISNFQTHMLLFNTGCCSTSAFAQLTALSSVSLSYPQGELQRWATCSICAVKSGSDEYNFIFIILPDSIV
jgi:hypothetical protein